MSWTRTWILLSALATVCSFEAADAAEGAAAVEETLRAYEQAWSRHDAQAVASFYYEPAMRVTATGPVVRPTRTDQQAFFKDFLSALVKSGYARSSWEELNVHLLDPQTAIASGITVRYRADGTVFARVGVTYSLRYASTGWKIFLSATHDPNAVARFREEAVPPGPVSDTAASELRAQAQALFGALEPPTDVDAQQAALGRALFFDTHIAPDGKTGCVSCHWPEEWGADPRPHSPDARGRLTERHSQTVFNATAQPALRWRADRRSAAHQAEDSLTGSMGFARSGDVVPVLKSRGYGPAFKQAFQQDAEPVSPVNWGRALEAYQRTLVTPASFDAYLRGDDAALTPRKKAGLNAFIANGCAGCHNGPLLGGRSNQKFGMVRDYWLATGSKVVDVGRQAITREESDRYVFRVPMLRNVAKTAPYFHDGSVAELRDAVRIMAAVQLGREINDADTADIVAFLEALTGPVPAHFAPP